MLLQSVCSVQAKVEQSEIVYKFIQGLVIIMAYMIHGSSRREQLILSQHSLPGGMELLLQLFWQSMVNLQSNSLTVEHLRLLLQSNFTPSRCRQPEHRGFCEIVVYHFRGTLFIEPDLLKRLASNHRFYAPGSI